MANENVNFEDLMTQEQENPENQSPFEVPTAPIAQQAQAPQQTQGRLQQLREARNRLRQKLQNAFSNEYDGYKLDTNQQGQAFFGTRGYAMLEGDKLQLQDLTEQIQDLEGQQRQQQTMAQQSSRGAAALAKRVFQQKIAFVNKALRQQVTQGFQEAYQTVDWGTPQLFSDSAKESLLKMLFNNAAQEAYEQHRRQNGGTGTPPAGTQDADTGDSSDDESPAAKQNEFGHEEGSIGWKISERFKERQNSTGIAADVYRQQRERNR